METPIFGRRDPDARGYFGAYGGRFVPETLVAPIEELTEGYLAVRADAAFRAELDDLLAHFVGRPTPLYQTRRLVPEGAGVTGVRLLLKREDLAHTGAHKINNALGQALLAKRMGKRRVVAETGAGQHGVATATVCATPASATGAVLAILPAPSTLIVTVSSPLLSGPSSTININVYCPARSGMKEGFTAVASISVAVLPVGALTMAQVNLSGFPSTSVEASPRKKTCWLTTALCSRPAGFPKADSPIFDDADLVRESAADRQTPGRRR
jgi:hypothetical protein